MPSSSGCASPERRALLREVVRLRESLAELPARAPPSGVHRLLHPYSREARFVLPVLTDSSASVNGWTSESE